MCWSLTAGVISILCVEKTLLLNGSPTFGVKQCDGHSGCETVDNVTHELQGGIHSYMAIQQFDRAQKMITRWGLRISQWLY